MCFFISFYHSVFVLQRYKKECIRMNRYTLFYFNPYGRPRQRNSNRRVIRIHFHDIRHIVPPFLHDRIGSHILRRLLSFSFLTSKQNICILVPINGVIIYSPSDNIFFNSGQMAACLFSYSFSKPGFKNILKASRFMVFSSFLLKSLFLLI